MTAEGLCRERICLAHYHHHHHYQESVGLRNPHFSNLHLRLDCLGDSKEEGLLGNRPLSMLGCALRESCGVSAKAHLAFGSVSKICLPQEFLSSRIERVTHIKTQDGVISADQVWVPFNGVSYFVLGSPVLINVCLQLGRAVCYKITS